MRYVGGGFSTDREYAHRTVSRALGAPATRSTPGDTYPAYRSSAVAAASAPAHQHFAFAARKLCKRARFGYFLSMYLNDSSNFRYSFTDFVITQKVI